MSTVRVLTSAEDLARYDAWIASHPQGSLWQSAEWRRYQQVMRREVRVYVCEENQEFVASALIVIDRTVGGFSVWECPRGPVWAEAEQLSVISCQLVEAIIADAKCDRCIQLFLSPAVSLSTSTADIPFTAHCPLTTSSRHIHPEATLLLDLTLSEDQLLAQMHPKGRYNINLAEKQGVSVASSADSVAFYQLLSTTSLRDGFKIHPESHYKRFMESVDSAFLLIASHAGKPIAGLLGTIWNTTGIYYYGASAYEHRSLMAPYALQWAAIRHCKVRGCTQYDLLGIDRPDAPATAWKGITEFKRKFGGKVMLYPPEQQLVLRPWVNQALRLKRKMLG